MSSYRHHIDHATDKRTSTATYSRKPTSLYDVGYSVSVRGQAEPEVFYFAGKKCHSQATEAAMKEIPGCVVTEVKLRR